MESFDGKTAILLLVFAIDSDKLNVLIWITSQRSLHHIETGCPHREYDTSQGSASKVPDGTGKLTAFPVDAI